MEPLCKNCKHWQPGSNKLDGLCMLGESKDSEPLKLTLAWADDKDSYQAWLVTKPNFGCVQFEAKGMETT